MNNPKNIQDELRSLDSGLPVNHVQPFSVPDGYFDGLAAAILAKVKESEVSAQAELAELSPLLAGIPKINPYAVPSSFFEDTVTGLEGLTGESESIVLDSIGKRMPYTVPVGYFEGLPQNVLANLPKEQARVVPMFNRTWMRFASAAVIAGALFFGYQLLSNKSETTQTVANTSTTSQQPLASSAQPIEKEMKQVSTKELEEFISTVQVTSVNNTESQKSGTDSLEIEELLKDVSTTEMENFLSAVAVADDEFGTTN